MACSMRVEPSMSLNRKVNVPRANVPASVIPGAPGWRSVPVGFGQIAQAAGQLAQDRDGDAWLLAQDSLEVPRREGEAARRSVGDDRCVPRLPIEDRQFPEEVPRAEGRDGLAVPNDPNRAVGDDEETRPDLALASDDMVRREIDLDRDRRDPFHPVGVDAVEQPGAGQQL